MKKLNLILVGLIFSFYSQSQVSQIVDASMYGGKIRGYAKNSSCVMVGTEGGIFKTINYGQSWVNVTQNFDPSSVSCRTIVNVGNDFYALPDNSTSQNIYKSVDNGTNWTALNISTWWPQSIGKLNSTLYAIGGNSGGGNIYTSTDGSSWTQRAVIWNGNWYGGNMELLSFNQNRIYINSNGIMVFTADGNTIDTIKTDGLSTSGFYSGDDNFGGDALGNLYYREDALYKYNFTTKIWSDITTGKIATGFDLMDFSATDNVIFAIAFHQTLGIRLYKSTDQGGTFSEITAPGVAVPMIGNIIEVATNQFIGNGFKDEIVLSSNGGNTWASNANQFIATYAGNLTLSGPNLLFSKEISGITRSINQGITWTEANSGLPGFSGIAYFIDQITQVKDTLFAFGRPDPFYENVDLYKSVNNGTTWVATPLPTPHSNGEDHMFAGKCDSALFVSYYNQPTDDYTLIASFNNGKTWAKQKSQNTSGPIFLAGPKNCLFAFNANTDWDDFNNVYKSIDFGANYTDINTGNLFNDNLLIKRLRSSQGDRGGAMMDFDALNNKAIFVVSDRNTGNLNKLYLFNISSNAWSQINTAGLPSQYVGNSIKYIGNNTWLLATNLGLYKSSNGGTSWTMAHNASEWQKGIYVNTIEKINNKVFLGTESNGIWVVDMTAGILKKVKNNELLIYPNPASSNVTISIPDFTNQITKVQLYGFDGKVLINTTVNSALFQINMANLSAGGYVIIVNSNNIIYRKKIIKN